MGRVNPGGRVDEAPPPRNSRVKIGLGWVVARIRVPVAVIIMLNPTQHDVVVELWLGFGNFVFKLFSD